MEEVLYRCAPGAGPAAAGCRGDWGPARTRIGILSLLLGTTCLSTVPAAAQTAWIGTVSNDWFAAANWGSSGAPNATPPDAGTAAQIDTTAPNATLLSGGAAAAKSLSIGTLPGQTGSLTVQGSSGSLHVGASGTLGVDNLAVGNQGTGSLTISGGATVTSDSQVYVAMNPGPPTGSRGTLLVTGPGSLLTANNGMWIAADALANGQVTVQAGGKIATTSIDLGFFASSASGTLSVDGAGSSVTASSTVTVGDYGTGTLNLTNGAGFTTLFTTIGSRANSNGTVDVSGAGTTFSSTAGLTIGSQGNATFNVSDGATAHSDAIVTIGSTASAAANISGPGTTWSTGNLLVGTSGNGTLTISDGAVVNTAVTFPAGAAFVGGAADVTGAGSAWNIGGNFALLALGIGKAGATSTLTVEHGGQVAIQDAATNGVLSDIRVGTAGGAGNLSQLVVTDAGSKVSTPYRMFVGYADGSNADVRIANGAELDSGFTVVAAGAGSTGSVTVTGAGSVWTVADAINLPAGHAQGLTIGESGSGVVTIADGGTVNVTATNSTVTLGGTPGSSATLNIGAAAGSPAVAPGTLNADTVIFATTAPGPLAINFNHTSNDYVFAPWITGSGPGTVNALAGTTIFTTDDTYTGATNVSAGATLQLGNGGATGSVTTDITDNGTVALDHSGTVTYGGVIGGAGALVVKGTGTEVLTGDNTYTGGTTIQSGTL